VLNAQAPFKVVYDTTYKSEPGLRIKDAILGIDGYIYMVGYKKSSNGNLKGVLWKMDSSGVVKEFRTFGDGQNCCLNGIIQRHNGDFVLVGETVEGKLLSPWLLEMDMNGNIQNEIKENKTGEKCRITHVAQNEEGKLLIAGELGEKGYEEFWVSTELNLTKLFKLEKSKYIDVIDLMALPNGDFFLLGNAKKNYKEYGGWFEIFSSSGNSKKEATGIGNYYSGDHFITAQLNPIDSSVVLLGRSRERDGTRQIFLSVLDSKLQNEKRISYFHDANDRPKGIAVTLNPQQFLLVYNQDDYYNYILADTLPIPKKGDKIWQNWPKFENRVRIKKNSVIEVSYGLLDAHNKWVFLGTWRTGKESAEWPDDERSGIWSLGVSQNQILSKDVNQLECGMPQLALGGGTLTANTKTYVEIPFYNKTNFPIKGKIRVLVQAEKKVTGLYFNAENAFDYIPSGKSVKLKFPLSGSNDLVTDQTQFYIRILVDNREICNGDMLLKTMSKISPMPQNKDQAPNFILYVPEENKRTTDAKAKFRFTTISANRIKGKTIFIKRKTGVMVHSKELINNDFDDKKYRDMYFGNGNLSIDLVLGRNELVFGFLDGQDTIFSEVIAIERIEPEPNLYFLGIAPAYIDTSFKLNYNTKDVRDFSKGVLSQIKLYKKIYIDTLTQRSNTTEDAIEKKLGEYLRKDIKSEDVFILYVSSHGEVINGNFCILPSEYDPYNKPATSLEFESLNRVFLNNIHCKVIVMIDACYSGFIGTVLSKDYEEVIEKIKDAAPGQSIFASSLGKQRSYEVQGNSVFCLAVLDALANRRVNIQYGEKITAKASEDDEIETISEFINFVTKRTRVLAKENSVDQIPVFINPEKLDLKMPLFIVPK
jgi:hypothetical protein